MFLLKNQKLTPFLQMQHRYQPSHHGGGGSAVQIKGGSVIISNIKTNPQQVIITDYSAGVCVGSILISLMLDDVTVQERRTSHYCFLYLLFSKICLSPD